MSREARKAVVMARGLGRRMRQAEADGALSAEQASVADTGIKALMPVGGRPFLDYVISGLADAGYEKACLVIAPDRRQFFARYEAGRSSRLDIRFAVQQAPRGTADAVLAARGFAADDLFLVINSDNYYPLAVLRTLRLLGGPGLVGFDSDALVSKGNIDPARIARYALLETDADGFLQRIVEKPDTATVAAMGPTAPVSMNCWVFGPTIFEACAAVRPSARGELELADAVQGAIAKGERFRVVRMAEGVLDMTSRTDVASVERRLRDVDVRL